MDKPSEDWPNTVTMSRDEMHLILVNLRYLQSEQQDLKKVKYFLAKASKMENTENLNDKKAHNLRLNEDLTQMQKFYQKYQTEISRLSDKLSTNSSLCESLWERL